MPKRLSREVLEELDYIQSICRAIAAVRRVFNSPATLNDISNLERVLIKIGQSLYVQGVTLETLNKELETVGYAKYVFCLYDGKVALEVV
jgi:prefoldin subunit 5